MPKFIFDEDTVVSVGGCHTARFLAKLEREVPEVFRKAALAAGGTPVNEKPAPKKKRAKKAPVVDRKAKIAEATVKLLDSGDKSLLNEDGFVRTGALEAALGFEVTDAERDEAAIAQEV